MAPSPVGSGRRTSPELPRRWLSMAATVERQSTDNTQSRAIAAVLLLGAAVAVALGSYAKLHTPAGRPIVTFGFSGVLQMKAWLATAALAFVVVQLLSALWMWGRLPGAGSAPGWL